MIWSTPSSRNAQVVARSAVAGGMGNCVTMAAMKKCVEEGRMKERGGGGGTRRADKSRAVSAMAARRLNGV